MRVVKFQNTILILDENSWYLHFLFISVSLHLFGSQISENLIKAYKFFLQKIHVSQSSAFNLSELTTSKPIHSLLYEPL